jgi:hypothetical protein
MRERQIGSRDILDGYGMLLIVAEVVGVQKVLFCEGSFSQYNFKRLADSWINRSDAVDVDTSRCGTVCAIREISPTAEVPTPNQLNALNDENELEKPTS